MMNSIPKTAGPATAGLCSAKHTSPPQWWPGPGPYSLDKAQVANLRVLLTGTAFLENPDWRLALEGDTARAVRITLHTATSHRRRLWAIDYAASALMLCAADGDAAAAVTLAYLRRRTAAPRLHALREA